MNEQKKKEFNRRKTKNYRMCVNEIKKQHFLS